MQDRIDIAEIARMAAGFHDHVESVRRSAPVAFDWYPYDSLASFSVLNDLLTGERRFLPDLIRSGPVLDVGCGDGQVAFFLESLGCKAAVVDNPRTNYNGMQGVRALKALLNSSVEIHERDIDYALAVPGQSYSVAFVFGLLYHLKNPFRALELLSRKCRYCVLSTRVARFAPDQATLLEGLPVAYLLGESELNDDATNYWIFTNAGLKQLMKRAGWRIIDYLSCGNTGVSDPASLQGDERAFCFAERSAAILTNGRLLKGWHIQESSAEWRWTERTFSVVFDTDQCRGANLILEMFIPLAVQQEHKTITLGASVNGIAMPSATYSEEGEHVYEAAIPFRALSHGPVIAEFTLDKALAPSNADRRELGIIVYSVTLSTPA